MCTPMTIFQGAMFGLSAAGSLANYFSERDYAKAQYASINRAYAENMQAMQEQETEINATAMEEKSDVALEALKKRAQVRAAAGEAGLSGLVVDSLMQEVYFQKGWATGRIEESRRRAVQQNYRQRRSMHADTSGALNAVKRPNFLGTLGEIGGAYAAVTAGNPSRKSTVKKKTTSSVAASTFNPL